MLPFAAPGKAHLATTLSSDWPEQSPSAHQCLSHRYHWKCTAASAPGRLCFPSSSPHGLHASAPTLSFAANSLSDTYDQFLVTLTVSSHGRNSSEAQVFLSTRPDSALRYHLHCNPHSASPRSLPSCALHPAGVESDHRNLLCIQGLRLEPRSIPAAQEGGDWSEGARSDPALGLASGWSSLG